MWSNPMRIGLAAWAVPLVWLVLPCLAGCGGQDASGLPRELQVWQEATAAGRYAKREGVLTYVEKIALSKGMEMSEVVRLLGSPQENRISPKWGREYLYYAGWDSGLRMDPVILHVRFSADGLVEKWFSYQH